jgi:hypothetical protein
MKTLDLIRQELQSLQQKIADLVKSVEEPPSQLGIPIECEVPVTTDFDTDLEEQTSVLDLKLSIRSRNGLYKAGIDTVGDLMGLTRDHLLKIDGLSKVSADEICLYLYEQYGYEMDLYAPKKMKRRFIFDKQKFLDRQTLTHKSEVYKRVCVVSDFVAEKAKWDWSKSQADLAKQHGLTRERVRQIRNKLIAAGYLKREDFVSARPNQSFKI